MAKDGTFEPAFIRLKQKILKEPSVPHLTSSSRGLLDLSSHFQSGVQILIAWASFEILKKQNKMSPCIRASGTRSAGMRMFKPQ